MRAWALLIVLPVVTLVAQVPRFRSGVDAVRVDVLVTRNGKPVPGLTPADFELFDSGVRQAIETVTVEDLPLNLLLLFDTSSSVKGPPLDHLKRAANEAIGALRQMDRAALMTFSHAVRLRASWTADRTALRAAIAGLDADGFTSIQDAVSAALSLRDSTDGRVLVLLFSDGLDTSSWLSPLDPITDVKRSDVVIYAVSREGDAGARLRASPFDRTSGRSPRIVLPPVSYERMHQYFLEEPRLFRWVFLRALADESGGRALSADDTRLAQTFVTIVGEFKRRYLITYSPQNVPPTGWHPLEVRLKGKRADITARRGYLR